MAFPQDHKLLTISGSLFTGTLERWSFGLRFSNGSGFTEPTQAMVDATVTPLTTFMASAVTFGQYHGLDTAKLVHIGVDGKYPAASFPFIHTFAPALFPPGTNGGGLPSQVSQVASLVTIKPRGLAHAGRIYLPPTAGAIGTDGRWSTAFCTGVANSVKALVNSLNAISGMGTCAVYSDKGAGNYEYVTGIRVGRVPDTVRRRRRQLVEGYQSVTL